MIKSVFLHDINFSADEFKQIGKSGLHLKTEKFYIEYGVDKAIQYYMNIKECIRLENGEERAFEIPDFRDCIKIIDKLLELKKQYI